MITKRPLSTQAGATLVVSLLMLLVLTLIGVTAMQSNVLQEKMAGNFRDANLAFQAAEAALRDGEADIGSSGRINGLTNFAADCSYGLCDATSQFSEVLTDATKKTQGVTLGTFTSATSLSQLACQPKYWIEGFKIWPPGSPSWKYRYRITASGCGGTPSSRAALQSVFAP